MEKNTEERKYKAKPEFIPKPTYWPFMTAFGLMLTAGGILMTWMVAVAGLVIFLFSLIQWLKLSFYDK